MKRLVIASVLLFLFFSSLINAQWIYVTDPAPFFGSFYVTSHNSELYLASNKDIFKTTDEGNSWINLTQGFVIDLGNANRFIQFAGTNIFVGTTVLGIFVSPDNGSTWQMDTMGLESVRQVDLLYTDGTNIFAGMWWPTYGLYTKAAAPGPWTRVNSNSIGSSYDTQVFGMTKIGNTFYAATRSSGVYESNDNGVNWTQKANDNYPAPVDGYTSNRLVSLGSDLFIASTDGVFKSMDLADSWVRVDQGFAVWDQFSVATIRSLYTDGLNLYASMEHDDSAYVSSDA